MLKAVSLLLMHLAGIKMGIYEKVTLKIDKIFECNRGAGN